MSKNTKIYHESILEESENFFDINTMEFSKLLNFFEEKNISLQARVICLNAYQEKYHNSSSDKIWNTLKKMHVLKLRYEDVIEHLQIII